MELSVTLNYGPLNAEFSGGDQEEIQDNLVEFVEFLKENEETFEGVEIQTRESGGFNTPPETGSQTTDVNRESSGGKNLSSGTPFDRIVRQTGTEPDFLAKLIELPNSDDGVPSLNLYHFDEGTEVLGRHRNQRQAQASALLLYIWEECLGKKKIDYESLDEALIESDIETERRDAMGQAFGDTARDWFEFEEGEAIWVVGTGKNKARDLIEELSQELDGE